MITVNQLPAVRAYCEERISQLRDRSNRLPQNQEFAYIRISELESVVSLVRGMEAQQGSLQSLVNEVVEGSKCA